MDLSLRIEVKRIIKENIDKLDTNEFSDVLSKIYEEGGDTPDLIKVLFWLLKIQIDPLEVCKTLTLKSLFGDPNDAVRYGKLISAFFDEYFKVFPRKRNLKISGDGVVFDLGLLNFMRSIYSISFSSCQIDAGSTINNNSLYSFTIDSSAEVFSERIKFGSCSELTEIITPKEVQVVTINCPKFQPLGKITGDIKPGQFYNNSQISNFVVDDSTEVIGPFAFYKCQSLKQVTFGQNVKIIGASAFAECSKLSNITIPESVTMIQKDAFQGSGVSSITFKGNPRIDTGALNVADIKNLIIYCDQNATNVISAVENLAGQKEFDKDSQLNFI